MKFCSPLTVLKQPCFAWDCEALMEAGKAAKGSEIISVFWGETSGSIRNQKDQEKKKKVHSKGIIYSRPCNVLQGINRHKGDAGLGFGDGSRLQQFSDVPFPCFSTPTSHRSCTALHLWRWTRRDELHVLIPAEHWYRPAQHRRGWSLGAAGMSSSHIHPLFHWILC